MVRVETSGRWALAAAAWVLLAAVPLPAAAGPRDLGPAKGAGHPDAADAGAGAVPGDAAGEGGGEDPAWATTAALVTIHGNQVLIDEVYFSVLRLPAGARADQATAGSVEKRIRRFLHRAGYTLATVSARVEGHTIAVEVDEGKLEKVVFIGRGPLTTLQLKLALSLPKHVYNKPLLDRQVARMKKKFGLRDVTYRIVLTNPPDDHSGRQFEELGSYLGDDLIVPSGKYELHILLGGRSDTRGWGLDLDYDYPDGLAGTVTYNRLGLLLADDRLKLSALLGGKLRSNIDTDDPYPALSHAFAGTTWFTPPLVGRWLRPSVWVGSDLVSRQRRDLGVEIYYNERLEAGAAVGAEMNDLARLSLGGGMEHRILFGADLASGSSFDSSRNARTRPFADARVDLVLQPYELRVDRTDRVTLTGRQYWQDGAEDVGRTTGTIRKLLPMGWHDLWVTGYGVYLWGGAGYDDDEPVGGSMLRGVFGDTYYTSFGGSLSVEFRYSLTRDLLKVSAFHDAAFFLEENRAVGTSQSRVADSFGVGFHALLLDTFQLNIYYALGFSSDGSFDQGSSANLEKVF